METAYESIIVVALSFLQITLIYHKMLSPKVLAWCVRVFSLILQHLISITKILIFRLSFSALHCGPQLNKCLNGIATENQKHFFYFPRTF